MNILYHPTPHPYGCPSVSGTTDTAPTVVVVYMTVWRSGSWRVAAYW